MNEIIRIILVGIGATALMDIWSMLLKILGIPTLNYALVGRWVGHIFEGKILHTHIGKSIPVQNELWLGWGTHYITGILFCALLVHLECIAWLNDPKWLPAVVLGAATVIFPFFIMQPAMGMGFAAQRTPTPLKNCMRSFLAHLIFGYGLYLSAKFLKYISI